MVDWDNYDWMNAMEVSIRDSGGCANRAVPDSCVDTTPFLACDISYTLAAAEGENDGADWLWVGCLKDGRWAMMAARCDYTGWG